MPSIRDGTALRTRLRTRAWADGWIPADIGLPNPAEQLADFRQSVIDNGRDPDSVPVTVQAMLKPDHDMLHRYEDLGDVRDNVGVAVDQWDKPDQVMPMIDRFGDIIAKL